MKKIFVILMMIGFVYAGLFPSHFIGHFQQKLAVLKEVIFIFTVAVSAYLSVYFFSERYEKNGKTIIIDIDDAREEVDSAERWILNRLSSAGIAENHGVTLLEHSLAVAEKIRESDPSRVAYLAALAHDLGKTIAGSDQYHDKLSASILRKVRFTELSEDEQNMLVLAVKYHHDIYFPSINDERLNRLIENLKFADMAVTGIEKKGKKYQENELKDMIVEAFYAFIKTAKINDTERVSVICSSNMLAVTEIAFTENVLNNLSEDVAVSIGAGIKRAYRKLHPAFITIRDCLGDLVLYEWGGIKTSTGLFNLRSGKKVIHAVVLLNYKEISRIVDFNGITAWPYELKVLPWQQ